jgi:integrase
MGLKTTGYPNLYLDPASGIYHVRKMVRGEQKTRSTGQTTLKAAIGKIPRILVDLTEGALGPKAIPRLNDYWATYCEAKVDTKSPRTWKREKQIMEGYWLPQLGKLQLDEITPSQIERATSWRRKMKNPHGNQLAEGTIQRELSLLHAVFEAAIDDDHLGKNPMRKMKRKAYKTRKRIVTVGEQAKLEAVMTPLVKRFFRFLLATGVRLEEVRGIVPAEDFDWTRKVFKVTGKGSHGVAKVRFVPLIPEAEEAIRLLVEEQIADNEGDGKHHRSDRSGTLWAQNPDELRQWLYLACDKADIERFGPHTLRHTFATRYLQGGGRMEVLSKILGHASISVTERVYAHLTTEDLAALSAGVKIGVK